MDKQILLPTDFSINALNAIQYALSLYAEQTCDFYFLNVYQVDGYAVDNQMMVPEPGAEAFKAAKKKSEMRFEKLVHQLKSLSENPKHTYHTISTHNDFLAAITDIIAKKDIDMVVMGTKGNTNARTIIYGTNTMNIIEKVKECPVLVIPEGTKLESPKEIVFPTDFKTVFKRRNLGYLIEIANIRNAFIRVLHIAEEIRLTDKQESNQQLLEAILEKTNHTSHTLTHIKVHAGIAAFIQSRQSDMIAIINRKRSFFDNMISKPLVKELGYHSHIPMLVLNDYT